MLYQMLVALLNGSVSGGLHPDQAPEDVATPYAVYAEIASPPINHLSGQANLRSTRVQITVWSKTKVEAASVAATLYSLMQAQDIYGSPIAFTIVPQDRGTSVVDQETRLHGVIMDFNVWHY